MPKRPLPVLTREALIELVGFCEANKTESLHVNMTAPGGRYHVVVTRNPHFVQLLETLTVHVPDEALSRIMFANHGIGTPPEGGVDA